jgi:hypothetical protein
MTLQTPPSWLQAGSYPAQYDRLTAQALWATTGIIGTSSLEVTANSPASMSVRVASGWAAIVGTTTTNMGVYTIFNDAIDTLTITTADPTNPRIDLVCATVRDAFYSGANNDVIFQVIAGTPAGSPVAPSLPANSISLATVAVAAGAIQINSGNITDTRTAVTTNIPETGDISSVTAGAGLTGGGSSGAVTLAVSVATNAQTGTSYTLALADNGKIVTLSNASAITLTVPTNGTVALPVGAQIALAQFGVGQVTVAGAGGVTVNSTPGLKLRTQYSGAALTQISANNWLLTGDLSA